MAEIVVRPMEVKGQSQEPVRVFCENGANLLQALLDAGIFVDNACSCLLYTSPSPRDRG